MSMRVKSNDIAELCSGSKKGGCLKEENCAFLGVRSLESSFSGTLKRKQQKLSVHTSTTFCHLCNTNLLR